MKQMFALLKREILEHRTIWFIPLILVGIAVLVKLAMSFGSLSIDLSVPSQLQLDSKIDSVVSGVMERVLNGVNYNIARVIMIVSCFYALSCLYSERQDESVLFWRSLPISDTLTVASKLIIALLVAPIMALLCQIVVTFVFLDIDAFGYLPVFFDLSVIALVKMTLWTLIPTASWCLFCSQFADKNPFVLAFFAPVILWIVDSLFLDGFFNSIIMVNRWISFDEYYTMPLVSGLLMSVVFIVLAVIKRSQRI